MCNNPKIRLKQRTALASTALIRLGAKLKSAANLYKHLKEIHKCVKNKRLHYSHKLNKDGQLDSHRTFGRVESN